MPLLAPLAEELLFEGPEAAREDLEWRGVDYVKYDVERDREAYEQMLEITGGNPTVPVVVGEGKPVRVGWMGGHR